MNPRTYLLDGMSIIERSALWNRLELIGESDKKETILPIIPPEHRLYSELQQVKSKLIGLQNKYNRYFDKSKTKRYTISK